MRLVISDWLRSRSEITFATVDEICIEQQRTHSLYLNILSDVIRLDVTARYGTATRCIFWSSHHVLNVRLLYTRLDDCRSSRMKELAEGKTKREKRALTRRPQGNARPIYSGRKREKGDVSSFYCGADDSPKPKGCVF